MLAHRGKSFYFIFNHYKVWLVGYNIEFKQSPKRKKNQTFDFRFGDWIVDEPTNICCRVVLNTHIYMIIDLI